MMMKSIVALLCLLGLASALTINLSILSGTTFPSPIGIDYQETSKNLILSVNYPSGQPRNLRLLLQNGSYTDFSSLNRLTDEVKVATVRSGVGVNQGGFAVGDAFTGNGNGGQIVRVSADGSTVQNPWVTLPGETGLLRGSLYIDRVGTFGGDLIVCTTRGGVWRVTSAGVPTRIAVIPNNVHLEGLVVAPNDPVKFGFLAGKILVGAEDQGALHVIDNTGRVNSYSGFGFNVEDLDIIEGNFYGVNYGTSRILAAPAAEFASVRGEILATQEFPAGTGVAQFGLALLSWDDSASRPKFTKINVANGNLVGQWEHVTFAPIGINNIPPSDFPGCENKHTCAENSVQTSTNGKEVCICFDSTPCPK